MNKKTKKILLSLFVFLISILVIITPIWKVYADAEVHINGGELINAIDEAARVQVIANTMKKCIPSIYLRDEWTWDMKFKGEKLRKNAWLMFYGSTTNIPTGAWLEYQVQSKVDDGDIWCSNNDGKIANLFAQYVLGGEDKYVYGMVCDSKGEAGGMYIAYSKDGETNFGCATAEKYLGKSRSEIEAYLKSIYEEARNSRGNEYWQPWDKLGDYTGKRGEAVGYWMYRHDFAAGCESNDNETTIRDVSLDYEGGTFGKIEDKTVRVRSGWTSIKFHNALGTTLSCSDLKRNKLGHEDSDKPDYAKSYSDISIDYLASQCKAQLSPFIKSKLEEYYEILFTDTVVLDGGVVSGSDGYSQEDLDKMKAYYDEWKDYESMDDREFIEETEKGGYQCNTRAGAEISLSVIDPEDPSKQQTCANSGGAGSLGWIVCPVLEWMGDASKKLYNDYVEPSLNVRVSLFEEETGNDNDVHDAWNTFQNFANIAFIILFLIVIFSQLTGVGIDNYGIKKILPKLIVVAVLVNVSYYICLICVDLSNIVGNGLQSLFEGLGSSLRFDVGTTVESEVKSTALTAVPILVGLIATGVAIWSNPAILLSLLVSALGVVISVFFLFILLSARQAAIVVLTVLSPLAFVCYALPNTKKLFDKWLNIGKGLLLVYPICGLLVGGGGYVSKLLMAAGMGDENNGFISAFSAMMVSIIPIFFIPSVLKGSFAALGNLGAKISGFGERLRGGATRGIRNMEGYKNAQRMGLERRTRLKAGLNKDGNLTKRGERRAKRANTSIGRFFGADKRKAAYLAQAKKDIGASEAAGAALTGALARTGISQADALPDPKGELGSAFDAHTEGAYYGKAFLDSASKGDITKMNAAIEAMRASGMKAKDIAKIMRFAQNNGYYNNIKDSNTRAAWMRDMAKKYGNDFMSTDFELSHFMANGGSTNGGNLGGYGEYAVGGIKDPTTGERYKTFGIDDVKPEDVLKLSGDSLAGMISSGKIDQGMAQRVMSMNPNMSADKRIMLGALASGAVGAGVDVGQFKNDATTLAGNRNATVSTITSSGSDSLATLVARWTAPTAQRTTVVQEFFGEEDGQIRPVDVSIVHGDAGSGGGTGGGDVGGITTGGGTGGGVPQGDLMGVHDDFLGETHVNSGTGKIRTYDRMDMYPRMKGESSEAYGARLKMMREKEEEFIRSQNGNRG